MNYQKHLLRTVLLHKRELETVGKDVKDIIETLKDLQRKIDTILLPVAEVYFDLSIEDLTRIVQEIEGYVSKM